MGGPEYSIHIYNRQIFISFLALFLLFISWPRAPEPESVAQSCVNQISTIHHPEATRIARRVVDSKSRGDVSVPIFVVNPHVVANQGLLPRLIGPVSPHLITVLLGLQQGNEVDASPHLLTRELTIGPG